jgi:hypothetical protein
VAYAWKYQLCQKQTWESHAWFKPSPGKKKKKLARLLKKKKMLVLAVHTCNSNYS